MNYKRFTYIFTLILILLVTSASGSGEVELAGKTTGQDINISGSGDATIWTTETMEIRSS